MRSRWAYAYQMVPPQPSRRLGTIRALLKDGTMAALGGARTWAGRLVLGRRATHILIVSDARGQDRSINRRLEAELERLGAAFSVTAPLAVAGHAEGSPGWPSTTGTDDRQPSIARGAAPSSATMVG